MAHPARIVTVKSEILRKLEAPASTPADEICRCAVRPPIKLMHALGFNPIHCLRCNLEVDPRSLPLTDRVVDDIAAWRDVYGAIDRLWLDSGPYEGWAADQLADLGSPINLAGRSVQARLQQLHPCYYWVFQRDESSPPRRCPLCSAALTEGPSDVIPQWVCERCRLVGAGDSA